ncbi:MAG: SDR family oxidoreductase, partial [SAR202 cluster bacterium]|nr:SDR family oxidoreductase [SAR202 cluster bacterium]
PINKIKENFDVNFFSQMFFTQYLVKGMIKNKKGSIVNISSSSAIEANIGRIAYAASKSSLITASKVIANELGKFNIRVNAIAPGLTDTDMMKNSTSIPVLNETIKRIPLGRIAKPLEIANVVLFLSSDLSSYITGQVLRVDGGM